MSHSRLTPSDYFSPEIHQLERQRIFEHGWTFAGVLSDFPEVGSYLTVQCGHQSLIILKTKSGDLIALHNVCRHRAVEILEGCGQISKNITCPYHRWTYDLDGKLLGAPDAAKCFDNLDRGQLGLKQGSVGILKDLVFVHPDPDQDFESWTEALIPHLWPHDLSAGDIGEAEPIIYNVKCNWKVFAENAIDGYHLSHLHEKTLGGPRPHENEWVDINGHLLWYAVDSKDVAQTGHCLPAMVRDSMKGTGATKIKGAEEGRYAGVYFFFPSTLIVPTPYSFSITRMIPLSPTEVQLVVRNWFPKGWLGGLQSDYQLKDIPGFDPTTGIVTSDSWDFDPLQSDDFQTEDIWITEKVQRGLMSPAAQIGPLAKGAGAEDPLIWFQQMVLAYRDPSQNCG